MAHLPYGKPVTVDVFWKSGIIFSPVAAFKLVTNNSEMAKLHQHL